MRLRSDLSARRVFPGAICLFAIVMLSACGGKSEAEVEAAIAAETAALRFQVELLQAQVDNDEREIRAACDRLTTNINLMNMMINTPGRTPEQLRQLQDLHDRAVEAKESLGCP